jgi:hypothetical protein
MAKDLRRYARQTQVQLFAGFILLLFLVGDGLIYLFYGKNAAVLGVICMLLGLSPLILIAAAILLLEAVVKKAGKD